MPIGGTHKLKRIGLMEYDFRKLEDIFPEDLRFLTYCKQSLERIVENPGDFPGFPNILFRVCLDIYGRGFSRGWERANLLDPRETSDTDIFLNVFFSWLERIGYFREKN